MYHYGLQETRDLISQLEPEYVDWLHPDLEAAARDPFRNQASWFTGRTPGTPKELENMTSGAVTNLGFPNMRTFSRVEKYLWQNGRWCLDYVSTLQNIKLVREAQVQPLSTGWLGESGWLPGRG